MYKNQRLKKWIAWKQKGFTLIELMIVMSLLVGVGILQLKQDNQKAKKIVAVAEAGNLKNVAEAANSYINMNMKKLQEGADSNCVWLNENCLLNNTALQALKPQLNMETAWGSQYKIWLTREKPALPINASTVCTDNRLKDRVPGCPSVWPNGDVPSWQKKVKGVVVSEDPWTTGGKLGGKVETVLLNHALSRLGAWGGIVNNGALTGVRGNWTVSLSNLNGIVSKDGQLGYLLGYDNNEWDSFVKRDGSTPLQGTLDMGGYSIRNTKDVFLNGSDSNPRNKSITSLMPNWVFKGVVALSDGDFVGYPLCESGGVPKVKLMMQVLQDEWAMDTNNTGGLDVTLGAGVGWTASNGTDYSYVAAQLKNANKPIKAISSWADDVGNGWTVHFRNDYQIDNANGNQKGISGKGLAEIYCHYL